MIVYLATVGEVRVAARTLGEVRTKARNVAEGAAEASGERVVTADIARLDIKQSALVALVLETLQAGEQVLDLDKLGAEKVDVLVYKAPKKAETAKARKAA